MLDQFHPLVFQFAVAFAFVAATMLATHLIGPKRKTSDKLANFESGYKAVGNARQPVSVKYFLVAIIFVLFDVEVIFMYPWAVNFKSMGAEGLLEMFTFIGLLLAGYGYLVKKGALDWE